MSELSADVMTLLDGGMSSTLQWFLEDVSVPQLASTMVGMANAEGGLVLLGVSQEKGEPIGIRDLDSMKERLFQAALQCEPTLVLPITRQVTIQAPGDSEPVNLLVAYIPQGLPHVYNFGGRYFSREGSNTIILSAAKLYYLLNQRGSIQFESNIIPDASVADLDSDQVMAYARSIGQLTSDQLTHSYDFLVKRGCLKNTDGEYQLTNAALLLFGKYPQQWFPNATILAGRFQGINISNIYIKQDISGNLLQQLKLAEEFIRANLRTVVRLVRMRHTETLEYPFEAVRELVVNAVAHRDYNLQGDNIHINMFSDRFVVSSPGTLPGPVTLENLLVARFARNAIITQVLSDFGYIERLGYGLDRVVQVAQQEGLPPPQFDEFARTFQVTLFNNLADASTGSGNSDLSAYSSLDLNTRQQTALTYLGSHQRITSHEFQWLCSGVHAETIRRDLSDLVKKGILIKVGDRKATYYILKKMKTQL